MHEILSRLEALLQSSSASDRKSAVFCVAEMRIAIGKRFDVEINKLPTIQKHMIQFYVEKLSNSSE
jgi:hypothetical protein